MTHSVKDDSCYFWFFIKRGVRGGSSIDFSLLQGVAILCSNKVKSEYLTPLLTPLSLLFDPFVILNVEPALAELEKQAALVKQTVLPFNRNGGGGSAMLLFGLGLVAGIPHARAEESIPREIPNIAHHASPHSHERVAHPHPHLSASRIFHQRIEAHKHSPASDLSLHANQTMWGGMALTMAGQTVPCFLL